jgi:glutathione synthase/RimK-type ligase-like ATP-grasp enzyme
LRTGDYGGVPSAKVAIATCSELPELDQDGPAILDALTRNGIAAEPVIWDSQAVSWGAYELVVVRSTWDYASRRDAFVDWAYTLPRVANPASVIEWNTDKRYLEHLASASVPVVPTLFAGPDSAAELPPWAQYVIKPTVSAGSADTARWRRGSDDDAAFAHLRALQSAGRTAMLQPYLAAVDDVGESALVYLGGVFSHSVRKGPILSAGVAPTPLAMGDDDPREQITGRTASVAELALAERVLDSVPGGRDQLLYARVDLLPGEDGAPVLLELELTEPSLFLAADEGAADRLAAAIVALLNS